MDVYCDWIDQNERLNESKRLGGLGLQREDSDDAFIVKDDDLDLEGEYEEPIAAVESEEEEVK